MVETNTHVEGCVFTHNIGWVPEHLKHPLKTVGRYWSLVSDCGQMARVCGDIVTPYIPKLCGNNDVFFHFLFSDSHVFGFTLDGKVDGPLRIGPTDMVDDHWAYCPNILFFLGLRACLAEQWSSAEALSNQLPQVNTYHRYASLHGTSSLETGVVLCPHVSGLHQDRKVFIPYL